MMESSHTQVDYTALKANQAAIITLNIGAFLFEAPGLVFLVAAVMAAGALFKFPGFGWLVLRVSKPLGWLRADLVPDDPAPHRFALMFGAIVMTAAASVFLLGAGVLGWALTWVVTGLAALNLFSGFCAGCAVYYWLGRLNYAGKNQANPKHHGGERE